MQISSHLYIKAGYKNDKTFLKEYFCQSPFKAANITEDKSDKMLRLMITSSSPGVLDNDDYKIDIEVEKNADVHITTQGYQRLFTMNNKAYQTINVLIDAGGSLCYLPHPCVPHKLSSFSSLNNIYLQKKHHLIWSDVITCGRKLNGEEFTFKCFRNVTNIYLQKKLVVKENILIEPLKNNIQAMGQMEGYTHQSTLLFVNDSAVVKKLYAESNELLSQIEGISFGISILPVNGLIFRMLGYKAEKLFEC